ncbi:hypothetical protein U619_00710 [Staphylococcus aureus F50126]|nr:hypothetical protein U619_00710 [Staphylococcus aureus F50126]
MGPNTENFEKKFYRQCELGCGPQHREIGFPISTNNTSCGISPNIEGDSKPTYNNVQVGGAPTQRISKRISTDNASWRGPNTEADEKSAYNNVQVGGAPTQKLAESQLTIMCKLGWDNDKVILFL